MWMALSCVAAAGLIAGALTPAMARLARRLDVVDRPGGYKAHGKPSPLLGGVAIYLGVLAGVAITAPVDGYALAVMAGTTAVFALGLLDDRRDLGVGTRLAVQLVAAAIPVAVLAWRVDTPMPQPTWLLVAIALLWIVGLTNAFNLLDNMDGVSAGVGALTALFLVALATVTGQPTTWPALAVAGACLGFLRANFPPATIFMGSAGSLPIGFLLAATALPLASAREQPGDLVPVAAIFFLPLLDTALVILSRLRRGLDPMRNPGRDHVAHRLVRLGLSVRVTVMTLYAVSAAGGVFGLWLAGGGAEGSAEAIAAAAGLAALASAAIFWLERAAGGGGRGRSDAQG